MTLRHSGPCRVRVAAACPAGGASRVGPEANKRQATGNVNGERRQAVVYVARPRCPKCQAVELRTVRSEANGDGTTTRRATCTKCGKRFFVVVE